MEDCEDYIKSKLSFAVSDAFTALAANKDSIIRVPAAAAQFVAVWLSLRAKVSNTGSVVLSLFEGSAGTNGTQLTPQNKCRLDTPPVCPVSVFQITAPTDGTALLSDAGTAEQPAEICGWILKPGTNYIYRLIPTSTPTGVLTLELNVAPTLDYLLQH